jgi:metallo-beta-lactamase family protein
MDGFSAHADQTALLHWLSLLGKKAEQLILVHGELEPQTVFSQKIQEMFGKTPIIPQLGEIIEFLPDQIVRHTPEIEWLSQDISIETREEEERVSTVIPEPISTFQPIKHTLKKRAKMAKPYRSRAQINRAYARLLHRLKQLINQGQQAHDFDRVVDLLDRMTSWLEEQERGTNLKK